MIYTFGDGFAAGHIWPEWPQLIEPILHQPLKNFGHIGAGNEYIYNCAIKSAFTATSDDLFLVQWTDCMRFDKLIEDKQWEMIQETDKVYQGITATSFDQTWWSTSASELDEINQYKSFYIQFQQATNRTVLYMITLSKILNSLNIRHVYFSTYSFDHSTHTNYKELKELPWIDFPMGMEEWSRDHDKIRKNEIQPSPLIHLKYIIEKILPKLQIKINIKILDEIYKLVDDYDFEPYHWDREQIWKNLKNEISLLCQ